MSTISKSGSTDGQRGDSNTRVDSPHASAGSSERSAEATTAPAWDLLNAIAGHDPQAAAQQLRGQALELAAILRDKQRLLEQRESELNARTALLENDLRSARLKNLRDEPPRIASADGEEAVSRPGGNSSLADVTTSPRAGYEQRPSPVPLHEQSAGVAQNARSGYTAATPPPQDPPGDTIEEADSQDEQFELLEQQRLMLRQREDKLERRERNVEQLHDEVTQLHREALELRLASQQVWSDLMEEFPTEELSQSMTQIRNRIADHYRLANDTLARRKDELHDMRNELNLQEQRLRQQRRDIQMWADRRYDEIESRMAKIIARERELDLMESEFQRQSIQWQQQRESYRQEIEQLSWQLQDRPTR